MSGWAGGGSFSGTRLWTVGALVQAVGDTMSARFGMCAVRGEVCNFTRAASGHGYFTLKDERGQAMLRCAMFRRALSQVDFVPMEGMLVDVRGSLAVYEARGELQLVVEGMLRAGAGALYEQFLRLKARLEAEGLFDAARKRAVPAYPRRLGVVTSLAAAALHDVLTALQRRAPHVEVVIAPCSVQGAEAPAQIAHALAGLVRAHREGHALDAVIVCRGGGSMEDLWAFNDERVVRAVAGCPIPVISGVGHETDVTLTDFAADLRAPTPTAAAELAATDRQAMLAQLESTCRHMRHRVQQRLDGMAQRLDQQAVRLSRPASTLAHHKRRLDRLEHRMLAGCGERVRRAGQHLPSWELRMLRAIEVHLARQHDRLHAWQACLAALDPRNVLERGYAWLSDEAGTPLVRAAQARPGQTVDAVMADGVLRVSVSGVHLNDAAAPKQGG